MEKKKKFVGGLFYAEPGANTPSFIVCKLRVQKEKMLKWLQEEKANEHGYINIDVKRSKSDNVYCEVNDFVPKPKAETAYNQAFNDNPPF